MSSNSSEVQAKTAYGNISPLGFHRYASEFLSAARSIEQSDIFSPVPYYLLCRALELTLKAFLLARGLSKKELKNMKKYGHDLEKLFNISDEMGLRSITHISDEYKQLVSASNDYYGSKAFEYFDVYRAMQGYSGLPDINKLDEFVGQLIADLEPCIRNEVLST